MMHQFNTQVAPAIKQGFSGVGAFSSEEGSSLANALSSMNVGAQQQYAQAQLAQQQQANQLNAGLYQNAANLQYQGIGAANQQSMLGLQQAQGLASALNPYQQNQQNQDTAQYQEYLRTLPSSSPYLQLATGITGQQQQGLYNQQSGISQFATGVAGLGAGITGLSSLGSASGTALTGLAALLGL